MATSIPTSERHPFSNSSSKTSFDLEPNPFEQSFAHKDEKQTPAIGSATSPNVITPGGRKLPPLVLSPNVPSGWASNQFPRTGLTPNESSMRTGLTPGGANVPHSLNNMNLSGLNTPGGSLGFTGFTPGFSSLLAANTKEFDQQAQANATNTANNVAGMGHVRADAVHPPQPTQLQLTGHLAIQGQLPPATADSVTKPEPQMAQIATVPTSPPKKNKRKGSTSRKAEEENNKRLIKKQKAEAAAAAQAMEMEDEEPNTEHMTEEEKRKSFLERNRVAASKCRQRKKQQIQKMETDLNFYLNEYHNLTSTVDSLKEQALILRNLVSTKNTNPDIATSVENILTIINQTNYLSRLRGDNPSNIIPTVQPINPNMVQQSQQRAAVAAISTIPPPPQVALPVQGTPQMMVQAQPQQPLNGQMSHAQQMPVTVGNGAGGKVMGMDWSS